ncbi:hypothetical protein KKG71_06475 [Patescibacteria group bacterium]|nr:hypothetical protein [Patescibacteria group bacterium]
MNKSFIENYLLHIVVFSFLVLLLLLIAICVLFIKYEQRYEFNIQGIDVVEVRLPTLELEKYNQIDKISKK